MHGIKKNLYTARNNERLFRNLKPISSAPSLSTINGCGVTLYGCTDRDAATGSYLATYYFVILGIPLFPICRYRVIPTENGYRFLGKGPLRTFDKWHMAISIGVIIWIIANMLWKLWWNLSSRMEEECEKDHNFKAIFLLGLLELHEHLHKGHP